MPIIYLQGNESAVGILLAQALTEDGTVKWRGTQCGGLVNDQGELIGDFHKSYVGSGWSISTVQYGGYASPNEVDVVPCPKGNACEFADTHYTLGIV